MNEILQRLANLERKINSMVRVGVVDTVDRAKERATVCFPAKSITDGKMEGPKTKPLPVLVKQTNGNRDYWMPDVGQWVVVVTLPTGVAGIDAFILGGWYGNSDPLPDGAATKGVRMVEFSDGARFSYNTETSKFLAKVGDLDIEITPAHIRLGGFEIEVTKTGIRFGGVDGTQPFMRGTATGSFLEAVLDLIAGHSHPANGSPPTNAGSFTAKKGEVSGLLSTVIKGR